MTKNKNLRTADVVAKIVDILSPLSSSDRKRVISASLTLLEEEVPEVGQRGGKGDDGGEGTGALAPRARAWATQNGVSLEELHQVFQIDNGAVELIAAVPGKSNKEMTLNAYILTGISKLLSTDKPSFDDKSARAICEASGCFDVNNHATYLKGKGNEFVGSKSSGWSLTAPGLKRAAALVKALTKVST